ncbi:MAG: Secretory immunoglobulin A-binding protein EsiB, partial [Candidatus Anoxychlamydiales bacterium]|nr:Secretory immunoglobulin A-binding protein EsiB [Candidatus Anoxychlamydiales bacterium]
MKAIQSQSNFRNAISENIEDAVSGELMTKAVTIVPCGHVFNEDTIVQILARNKLCPLDRRSIDLYIPNYTIRNLAETTNSPPLEEESYSAEAESYFLQGKKASETGDMEGAIEALLEALKLSPRYEKAQGYLEFCLQKAHPQRPSLGSVESVRGKGERETSCAKETYINLLLCLLEEPAITSNPSLCQLLGNEVEQLINQESEELIKKSLEKYQWTKRLFIDQKVSQFVVEKLQQLSVSSPSLQRVLHPLSSQVSSKPQSQYDLALKFKLGADQGDASAQLNLGSCYSEGTGVKQDQKEAVRWYKLAADQGYATAQNNLGFAYEYGKGVKQDKKEAVRW